jgi:hypothetical protein
METSALLAIGANRGFEFQKRSQFFIATHNETLSVAIARLRQSARAFGMNGCKIKRHR